MENQKTKAPRFKTYAIWLFFIFVAAVLLTANLLWLNVVLQNVAESVSEAQTTVALQAREVVRNFIETIRKDVMEKTAAVLAGEDKEKIARILTNAAESDDAYFARLAFFDEKGAEVVQAHRSEAAPLRKSFKPFEADAVTAALAGESRVSDAYFVENFGPVINITVPARTGNGAVGALSADVNLKVLARRLKDFKPGKSGQTYVVDREGRMLSHSNYFLVVSGGEWLTSRPILQKIVQQGKAVEGLDKADRYVNEIGLEVQAAGVPVPELGWGVVVEQPLLEMQTSSNRILTFGLISLGSGLVLIIILNVNFLTLARTGVALEKERDRVSAIVSHLTDGLIQYDAHYRIQLMNAQAEELLGVKESDVKGQIITRDFDVKKRNPKFKPLVQVLFVQPSDEEKKGPQQGPPVRSSEGAKEGEYAVAEVVLKEPQERWLKVAAVPILDYRGNITSFINVIHDVSRERAVAKMKSEFISVVAHQLRTPLSAIKWTLRMIIDGDIGQITPKQKDFLEDGYASNERMIELINDLLEVARIEEGRFGYEFAPTDLAALIEKNVENFQLAARSKNISLTFEKPSFALPAVTLDPSRVDLVLQNLIDNAVKYSLTDGKIVISISMEKDRPFVRVSVKDNGVGIPEHQKSRIFSKFFRGDNVIRLQTEGSGLGLFIVKNIVMRHGGDIWAESEEGRGTAFHFTLPLDETLIPERVSPFQDLIA